MKHITGSSRSQLRMTSLEDTISRDNPVRFIEAFVESVNKGNKIKTCSINEQKNEDFISA
jgi:hypothetical protein